MIRKFFLRQILRCLKVSCKFETKVDDLPKKGIFISNHVSHIDPILLYAFLPNNPVMVLNSSILRKRFVRFFLKGADILEFNPIDPKSLKEVLTKLEDGRSCLIFPESRRLFPLSWKPFP